MSEKNEPKKSKKKLIVILLIVILLLGAGGGGAWFFFMKKKKENHEEVVEAKAPVFFKLNAFTVNLQPEDDIQQVAQMVITLQLKNEDDVERMKLYRPQIRNRLLILISSKKPSEIGTVEGKQKLAKEIVAAVNDPFYPGAKPQSAKDALFTSFIVQ